MFSCLNRGGEDQLHDLTINLKDLNTHLVNFLNLTTRIFQYYICKAIKSNEGLN